MSYYQVTEWFGILCEVLDWFSWGGDNLRRWKVRHGGKISVTRKEVGRKGIRKD